VGTESSGRQTLIVAREDNLELSVQNCLEGLGISHLSELDVLAFVYLHGVTLASTEEIAGLIGYELVIVSRVLDRLECNQLIERSQPSAKVRFYRILAPADSERKRCLERLASLLKNRDGRLLLTKELKPRRPESQFEELSLGLEAKGNGHA
jgi:DNA-binding MarR family transcriptional regulator